MSRSGNGAEHSAPIRLVPITGQGLEDGRTVQSRVYEQLRRALMSGHFEPGEGISLRAAASALGTSLTPVREALRRLESEGGLVQGTNRMLSVPLPSVAELLELRNIRLALEGLATETAATLLTANELVEVTVSCEAMEAAAAAADVDAYLDCNWRFHSTIYQAARSPLLVGIIEGLWLRAGPLIRLATPSPGHLSHSMDCHWAAVRALRRGDGIAARAAIERDIRDAAQDLTKALQARKGETS